MNSGVLVSRRRPKRFGRLGRVNREPATLTLRVFAPALHAVLRLWTKADWRGGEKIPRTGPAILVANHISSLDPPLVGEFVAYHGRWPHFLARANLFDKPVLGALLRGAEQIPVHRNSTQAKDAMDSAAEALRQGQVVVVYPEGTITFDPLEWPMTGHTGAARLAMRTGAPVIPIGQWGANLAVPPRHIRPLRLRRHRITIVCGEPIDLSEFGQAWNDRQVARTATVRILEAITAMVEVARGETAPVDRWDPKLNARVPRDQVGR